MIDEKRWIHPLARAALDTADNDETYQWMEAGSPLLTDEAKAVLGAVEDAMKECNECMWPKECDLVDDPNASYPENYVPDEGTRCEYAMRIIRRAWKGGK